MQGIRHRYRPVVAIALSWRCRLSGHRKRSQLIFSLRGGERALLRPGARHLLA
jgi:hypothetical protein